MDIDFDNHQLYSEADLDVGEGDSDNDLQSPSLETEPVGYYATKDIMDVNLDDQISSQVDLDVGEIYSDGEDGEPDHVGDVDEEGGEPHAVEESSPYTGIGQECSEPGADTANIQWSKQFWDLLSPLTTKSALSRASAYCDMAELINNFSKIAGRLF